MKRRDWKIKELKKDIFGKKKKKSKYKLKNIFFLRRLSLRKNRKLKKKNFIMNFIFYRKLRNFFFSKFNNYTNVLLSNSLKSSIEVFPIFFFSKKIFFNFNAFYSFLENNNLDYLFLKNYNNNLHNNNLKVVIFNKKNLNNNYNKLLEVNNLLLNNKDNLIAISKNSKEFILNEIINEIALNYYFNYNIYILNVVEVYKILIFLHLNFFYIKIK